MSGRKQLLTVLAITGGYLLIASTNAVDWAIREPPAKTFYIILWEVLYNGSACITNIALCLFYSKMSSHLKGIWLILFATALCFVGGVIWVSLAHFSLLLAGMPSSFNFELGWIALLSQGGLASGKTLFLVSCIYFGIEYWWQSVEQEEKARQATALAHQAQLKMLRYQLNPHFLFNALNSIRGMIIEEPYRSREMVTELADFLRYSLDDKGQESTIADEIKAIENYLVIQRIRFEDRLDATMSVDAFAPHVEVPCFLIHPMVENAVKYGMKTSAMPLRIRIEVIREHDDLVIRVSNTGHLLAAVQNRAVSLDGVGIGLKNIRERLKLVFPDRHVFKIEDNQGWVRAEIRLQLSAREWQHEIAHSVDRG
ncbi:MAG: histidine kinase [Alphaproteobacteria bacterium]|nr:histidine kinase [Alphaproteobacteria bacterium]